MPMRSKLDRQKTKRPGVSLQQNFIPTPSEKKRVEAYMSMGLKQEDIARIMRISVPTLRRHFQYELDTGLNTQIAKVAQTLFEIATDKSHPKAMAAIAFFLKTRAGWRERIEITGADGQPLQVQHNHQVVDSRTLSPEQRDNLREILTTLAERKAIVGPAPVDAEYEAVEDEGESEED